VIYLRGDKMKNYEDIGLNDRLQATNSIPARKGTESFNPLTDFESQVERGVVTRGKLGTLTADLITGGTMSANYITGGTLTLISSGVNLVVESGTLRLNAGAAIVIKGSAIANAARLNFLRSDDDNSGVKFLLAEPGSIENDFYLDKIGTKTTSLQVGGGTAFDQMNIYCNDQFYVAGGSGTSTAKLTMTDSVIILSYGTKDIARFYPNGDLRILGTLGTGTV